ncbi:MAG TPA: DUF4231 domain-containing protein [Rhizomicrobium sp.]|jgi:hypothetical protein
MQPSQTSETKGPPKPRLVLRFGISGHRTLGEADAARVHDSLASLFGAARDELQQLSAKHRELFRGDGAILRLISPLAEGSDRVAAEAALAKGFALECPLPFARDLYEADFQTEASRKAFHSLLARASNVFELEETRGTDDNRAYEAAGLMTLRQCDILIAVWNGKPAVGRGGTAEIVAHAIDSNIPIVWVHSEKAAPAKLLRPTPMGTRDPALIPADDLSDAVLQTLLRAMVLPLEDPKRHVARTPSRRLRDYWGEKQRRFTPAIFYALLQMLVFIRPLRGADFRVADYNASVKAQWREYWRLLPPISENSREKLQTVLEPAFGWADGLASYYVRIYRSSYVLSFMLAAGAVCISLFGLWAGHNHNILFAAEFLAMVTVIVVVLYGVGKGWHDRWIDYRHLAELLRQMRVLTLTGSSTPEIRQTAHAGEETADSGTAWVGWYYRAIVRDIGMVGACADAGYAQAIGRLVQKTELHEQATYHRATENLSRKLDIRLDLAGRALFILTALVCAFYLAASSLPSWINEDRVKFEIFLASFMPAFGAALYGIRVQGEFGRIARRARHMKEQLSQISGLLEADAAKGTLTLSRVSFLTEKAAQAMALDVTDWRFVFREKPLTLPA